MPKINNSGLNTEPWGTPWVIYLRVQDVHVCTRLHAGLYYVQYIFLLYICCATTCMSSLRQLWAAWLSLSLLEAMVLVSAQGSSFFTLFSTKLSRGPFIAAEQAHF